MIYVSLKQLGLIAIGLPLFGVLFAVIWSILFDWEASCRTHCHALNYLPTVSSAIGGFTPQRYVWRICIMLQAGLRFMLAYCYYHWHLRVHMGSMQRLYKNMVILAVTCHVLENMGLVTLTCISSTENGEIHEYSFIVFLVGSQVYMLLTCLLIRWTHKSGHYKPIRKDVNLLRTKIYLFVLNVAALQIALRFYFRHNTYCEPYMYTWFALFEYITIFSNIGFHGLCCVDFGDYSFTFLQTEDIKSGVFKNC